MPCFFLPIEPSRLAARLTLFRYRGLGREVAGLIEDINRQDPTWNILGFVDDNQALHGAVIDDYPVLGGLDWLKEQSLSVVMGIGNPLARKIVIEKLNGSLNDYPVLVHPSALILRRARLGKGTIVCAGNIVSLGVAVGEHSFINLSCTVGHDVIIDAYCVLMPGVNVSGNVRLEECVSVGTGAAIIQGITVGERTVIGAGAVVVRDLPADCTAVGSPAKPIKFRE